MLQYFKNSTREAAGTDEDLAKSTDMVEEIRHNAEKGGTFMNFKAMMYFNAMDNREKGRDELLEEMVRIKLAKGVPESELPELLEQSEKTIKRILDMIREKDAATV